MARLSPPADEAAEEKWLLELGGMFRAVRGQYFSIITDAEPRDVEEFKRSADETFADVESSARHLGLTMQRPAHKLLVIVFDEWAEYDTRARRAGLKVDYGMPGFFDEPAGMCVLFNYAHLPLLRAKRRELAEARVQLDLTAPTTSGPAETAMGEAARKRERIGRLETQLSQGELLLNHTVVRHEIAHQALLATGVIRPGEGRLWLKEGLALQFESDFTFVANRHRLIDFFANGGHAALSNLRSLIADSGRFFPGADHLPEAYATAGVLVRYLIDHKPAAFANYLQSPAVTTYASTEGPARIAEFETAVGPLDESFALEFRKYANGLRHWLAATSDADRPGARVQQEGMQP